MSDNHTARPNRSFANDMIGAARENPLAASVLGMGVVWLLSSMMPRRTSVVDAVGPRLRRAPDAARETLAAASETIADSASAAGRYISDMTDSASGQFHDLSESAARRVRDVSGEAGRHAGEFYDIGTRRLSQFGDAAGAMRQQATRGAFDAVRTARGKIGDLVDDQPLLLVAGALVVGAAIAASLPATNVERQTLGETGKGLKDAAGEVVDAAASRLSDAAHAATQEARRQGLTPDALRDQAASLAERAKTVVSGADVNLPPQQTNTQRPTSAPHI